MKKILSFILRLIGGLAIAYAIAMLIFIFFTLAIGSSSWLPMMIGILIIGIIVNKIGNIISH